MTPRLEIPLASADVAHHAAPQRARAIRILLIEDNLADARLVMEMFSELGAARFELQHADRMSIGLMHLEREHFDALLLDLSLPDSQGLKGVERILAQVPTLPIVVLTGLDDERLSLTALEQGVQDYLVKGQVGADLLACTLRHAAPDPGFAAVFTRVPWCRAGAL